MVAVANEQLPALPQNLSGTLKIDHSYHCSNGNFNSAEACSESVLGP